MARAIWTGVITFGLVSVPVGLFTATEDHTVHFHQLQRGTSDRIRNRRVNVAALAVAARGQDTGDPPAPGTPHGATGRIRRTRRAGRRNGCATPGPRPCPPTRAR
ncbi:Non-homologous end joining protein Ku [Streptomyces alboniger]